MASIQFGGSRRHPVRRSRYGVTSVGAVVSMLVLLGGGIATWHAGALSGQVASEHPTLPVPGSGGVGSIVGYLTAGQGPWYLARDTLSHHLYLSNAFSNSTQEIDSATNAVVSSRNMGAGQLGIAYDPITNSLFEAMPTSVAVVPLGEGGTTSYLPTGAYPYFILFDPLNGMVYVGVHQFNTVLVINGTTSQVVTTIAGQNATGEMAVDPSNGNLYVADYGTDEVSVISGASNSVVATIPVGSLPLGVAYCPYNGDIYVTNSASGTVSVIDASTNTVTTTLAAGAGAWGIAYDSDNGYLYIANTNQNTVSVISSAANTLVTSLPIGGQPWGVVYDPDNGVVYVTNHGNGTVTLVNTRVQFPLTFTEAGLSAGTAWGVDVAGIQGTSTTASVLVSLPNGTYRFEVVPVSGFTAAPASGVITIAGAPAVAPLIEFSANVTTPPLQVTSFLAVPSHVPLGGTTYLNVSTTGGTSPFSFAFTGLPGGCSSASNADLVCTPTVTGSFDVRVFVNDSASDHATAVANLTVVSLGPTLESVSIEPIKVIVSEGANATIDAVPYCGGAGCPSSVTYVWSLSSTSLGTLDAYDGSQVVFTSGSQTGTVTLQVAATEGGVTVWGNATITVTHSVATSAPLGTSAETYGVLLGLVIVVGGVVTVALVARRRKHRLPPTK